MKDYVADEELMKQCAISACDALTSSEIYKTAPCVLGFMPMKDELDIRPILEKALKDGKTLYLPRMAGDEMDFFKVEKLSEANDTKNSYSIEEPSGKSEIFSPSAVPEGTLVLVPGLAFNLTGDRLGRGKGFYDKYLARLPERNLSLCGVCFTICVTKAIPVDQNDHKVNWLLTEYGLTQTSHK